MELQKKSIINISLPNYTELAASEFIAMAWNINWFGWKGMRCRLVGLLKALEAAIGFWSLHTFPLNSINSMNSIKKMLTEAARKWQENGWNRFHMQFCIINGAFK